MIVTPLGWRAIQGACHLSLFHGKETAAQGPALPPILCHSGHVFFRADFPSCESGDRQPWIQHTRDSNTDISQHRAQVPGVGVPGRSSCDCRSTRMGSHTVRAQLYRRWDAEQKAAKQAEARLSQCLQRLEETRRRHLALLAREQRQLQTQLQRLREGEPRAEQGPSTHPPGAKAAPAPTLVPGPSHGSRSGHARTLLRELNSISSVFPSASLACTLCSLPSHLLFHPAFLRCIWVHLVSPFVWSSSIPTSRGCAHGGALAART